MKRPISTILLLAMIVLLPGLSAGDDAGTRSKEPARPERNFYLIYAFDIKDIPAGAQRLEAWIPLPISDQTQQLQGLMMDRSLQYSVTTDPEYGNRFLRLDLSDKIRSDTGSVGVRVAYGITRRAYRPLDGPHSQDPATPAFLARFLKPDRLVPVSGKIADEARRAAGDSSKPLIQARRLYDYIVGTMKYDKTGKGWGRGDAVYACDVRAGNCTDFHSLFIAEARSLGIPARFVMGLPLPEGKTEGEIAGYHCWAEFYAEPYGWIPIDASEASKNPARKEALFGGLDANRIAFTIGRDIKVPGSSDDPQNFLIFPYIEVDGKPYGSVTTHFFFRDLNDTAAGTSPVGSAHGAATTTAIGPSDETFWNMLRNFEAKAFVTRYGYALAFLAMYFLGAGLTLTPCVYPMVPVTVGYFGSQSEGKWGRQLSLALVFGLGIAASYAAVGTVAALSGSFFGALLQNPAVLVAMAALCAAMGLNAFGFYELRLPRWLMRLAGGTGQAGFVGAAVMGLTMGVAGASCLAAFTVSLLAFVGQMGNQLLGFSMFLMLGLGLATPFVGLAVFSGMIERVPRSGAWLVYAKKVMGSLLFAAALYFLYPVLPHMVFHPLVMILLFAAALYFGFFEKTPVTTKTFRAVRLSIAGLFFMGALWWNFPTKVESAGDDIKWQPYSETALAQARSSGRSTIIYFHTDWCVACKEFDAVTLTDPQIIRASKKFLMLKADLTRTDSPETVALAHSYGIQGFPTTVFIGADGREIEDLRLERFASPDEMLDRFKILEQLAVRQTT